MPRSKLSDLIKVVSAAVGDQPAYVCKRTSYTYVTKTSARRGGYNRERITGFLWDGQSIKKVLWGAKCDELTGLPLASPSDGGSWGCYYWAIQVPRQLWGVTARSKGLNTESIVIDQNTYCSFFGSQESAKTLDPNAIREAVQDISVVGDRILSFADIFSLEWRKPFWSCILKVEVLDGMLVSVDPTLPPQPNERIVLIRPIGDQLSLF